MNDFVFDSAHVAVHKDPGHPLLIKAGNSRKKRIDLKCRSCIYDEKAPGNWRQQVAACECEHCPLWAVRPISKPKHKAPALKIDSEHDCGSKSAVLLRIAEHT